MNCNSGLSYLMLMYGLTYTLNRIINIEGKTLTKTTGLTLEVHRMWWNRRNYPKNNIYLRIHLRCIKKKINLKIFDDKIWTINLTNSEEVNKLKFMTNFEISK